MKIQLTKPKQLTMSEYNLNHSFDVRVAIITDVNAAIVFNNMLYWVTKNKANEMHFYDGMYWTYNSKTAYTKIFPYLTARQIEYAINRLYEANLIYKGRYSTNPYDKTNWYSVNKDWSKIVDSSLPSTQSDATDGTLKVNGRTNKKQYKTNINTNINTDINDIIPENEFSVFTNEIKPPTKEEIIKSVHKKLIDYWCTNHNPFYKFQDGKDAKAIKNIANHLYDVVSKTKVPSEEIIIQAFIKTCNFILTQNDYYKSMDLSKLASNLNSVITMIQMANKPKQDNETKSMGGRRI